jgi:hypothetical protein
MIALGDITERFLRFFGITKERVQAVTGKEDCGCSKRQEAMNQWGYAWQHRLAMPIYWLRYRWQTIRYGVFWHRVYMASYYLWMAARVLFGGR